VTEQTVLHAYGVIRAGAGRVLPDEGVHGAPVHRVPCDGYDVLCSRHSATELGEPAWQAEGQNPQWLALVAQQHHAVLQEVVLTTDVLPLRLPGVYADEETLCRALRESADALDASFDVLHGSVEWGVKVFQTEPASVPEQQARPATGRDYLRLRADQAKQQQTDGNARYAAMTEIHQTLATVSVRSAVSPVQDRALSGRSTPMLLNAAYLVSRARRDDFFAAVDDLVGRFAGSGFALEVTGPWPPYNFSRVAHREEDLA
jgi:hypothetical protein